MKRIPYSDTSVTIGRSIEQVRELLFKYGAEGVNFNEDMNGSFNITFFYNKMVVSLRFNINGYISAIKNNQPRRRQRMTDEANKIKAAKIMYRHAFGYLKTTLEAVDFGLLSFESAFMSHFQAPSGMTLGEILVPKLQEFSDGRLLLTEKTK